MITRQPDPLVFKQTAGATMVAFRIVKDSGGSLVYAGAGEANKGVLQGAVASGSQGFYMFDGASKLEGSAAIPLGSKVASAANGKARVAIAGDEIVGVAITPCTGDGAIFMCDVDIAGAQAGGGGGGGMAIGGAITGSSGPSALFSDASGTLREESIASFAFNTASPLVLSAIPAGKVVTNIKVTITTAFDDAAATLQVGHVATPALSLSIPANAVGTFENLENFKVAGVESLRLSISAGTSTQGAGYVTFTVRS